MRRASLPDQRQSRCERLRHPSKDLDYDSLPKLRHCMLSLDVLPSCRLCLLYAIDLLVCILCSVTVGVHVQEMLLTVQDCCLPLSAAASKGDDVADTIGYSQQFACSCVDNHLLSCIHDRYQRVEPSEAEAQWQHQYSVSGDKPERGVSARGSWRVRELVLIGGLVLPIWGMVERALVKQHRPADRRMHVLRLQTTGMPLHCANWLQ